MSFAECDGLLYATVGQQIFARSDGAQASWRPIYTNPFPGHSESGLRGLTAIAAPDGRGQVLLTAEEGHAGRIIRIDPRDGYKETTDLDLRGFLAEAWGTQVGYIIAAYNDMTKVPDGRGGEVVLIGFEAFIPRTARWPEGHVIANGLEGGGWYLLRHPEGRYDLRRIATVHPDTRQPLVATRAIAVSPFPDDAAVYFAGYDANKRGAHNTAWIFRAPLRAALDESRSAVRPRSRRVSSGIAPPSPFKGPNVVRKKMTGSARRRQPKPARAGVNPAGRSARAAKPPR